MTAYDYKNQVWREGVEGAKLLMEQHSETLRLLRGERNAEYAALLGLKPGEAPEFITNLEKQVKAATLLANGPADDCSQMSSAILHRVQWRCPK
jgi:hypothetical protein